MHSLRPRAEIVAAWKADVVAVQETKLEPHAIAEASSILKGRCYKMAHGAPCQPQQYRKDAKVTHAANEANSGGVAILTREHLRTIRDDLAAQSPTLHETTRWTELKVPVDGRTRFLTIASFYGISGSSSNDKKYKANEELLSDAIKRAIEAGDAPYLLAVISTSTQRSPKLLPPRSMLASWWTSAMNGRPLGPRKKMVRSRKSPRTPFTGTVQLKG